MKRILLIFTIALLALACEVEPTRPSLGVKKTQWDKDRTNSMNDTFVNPTSNFPLPTLDVAKNDEGFVFNFANMNSAAASWDFMKKTGKDDFEKALKDILSFASFANTGADAAKALPAETTPVGYTVVEYRNYQARIKFDGLSAAMSNPLEVRFNPAKFTHHGGQRLDVNNDGILDEYDTIISAITLTGGTAYTGPRYNYQRGLTSNPSFTSEQKANSSTVTFTAEFSNILAFDETDYGAEFNKHFKLQKWSAEKGWQDEAAQGVYTKAVAAPAAAAKFVFTIDNAADGSFYRVKTFPKYNEAIKYKTTTLYNGYPQKLLGNWNTNIINHGGNSKTMAWNSTNDRPLELGSSDAFWGNDVTADSSDSNVVVTLGIELAVTGDKGLPDPASAISSGIIKLGYYNTVKGNDFCKNVVFFPADKITVVPYRDDGKAVTAADPADRWRIIYPPEYKANDENTQSLFINGDYKTLGDATIKPQQFGDYTNIDLVLKEGGVYRTGYTEYQLGNW